MSTLLDRPIHPVVPEISDVALNGADLELHQQTVPRRLVHRASVNEVLVTGWRQIAQDRFLVGAQWPRSHSFYLPADGVHDPLMVAETLRQAGLLVSHAAYQIPLDYAFMMGDVAYQVDPRLMGVGPTPADVTITVSCRDIRRRRNIVSSMRCDFDVHRGGEFVGGGSIGFDCMTPQVYARLRGEHAHKYVMPVTPLWERAGRERITDSVLTPTPTRYRWLVEADPRHPVLFDHPVDHVPGMVLMEAMRQAATSVTGRRTDAPFGLDVSFAKYAELDRPVYVQAIPGQLRENGDRLVRVRVEQDDSVVAQGALDIRALPDLAGKAHAETAPAGRCW